MKYNQCQNDIIQYIIDYSENPIGKLTPNVDVFEHTFHEKYTILEIEESTRELISNGILKTYSFHSYLDFTEKFKTSSDYKLFKDKKKI
ncbi:MAG: hypothetical protein ACFFCV_11600 [Promethearchaeota archaeon]